MDPIIKIPKKFTKKFGNKVINRQYFPRKTGLYFRNYFIPLQARAKVAAHFRDVFSVNSEKNSMSHRNRMPP